MSKNNEDISRRKKSKRVKDKKGLTVATGTLLGKPYTMMYPPGMLKIVISILLITTSMIFLMMGFLVPSEGVMALFSPEISLAFKIMGIALLVSVPIVLVLLRNWGKTKRNHQDRRKTPASNGLFDMIVKLIFLSASIILVGYGIWYMSWGFLLPPILITGIILLVIGIVVFLSIPLILKYIRNF